MSKVQRVSKVALVVGYGAGIGHAVATKWAAEGCSVALISRTAEKLEAAAKTIPNSHAFPCDITDTESLQACLTSVESQLGPVDHLLYNAGSGVWKKYDDISVELIEQAMKTNVYGLLTCTQALCPKMVARGGGFVCVTGATASLRGMPYTSAFAAAKAAQRSLAQSIARQMWKENVHVCVGIIDAMVGTEPGKMSPESIASEYWHLRQQPKDCWSFQHHIQTSTSDMGLL